MVRTEKPGVVSWNLERGAREVAIHTGMNSVGKGLTIPRGALYSEYIVHRSQGVSQTYCGRRPGIRKVPYELSVVGVCISVYLNSILAPDAQYI